MRIGLSLLTHEGQNIWNNGIGQNVFHLACALASVPFVEKVVLINTGDQQATPPGTSGIGEQFELVPLNDCADVIDVVFEVSGGINVEWLSRFCCAPRQSMTTTWMPIAPKPGRFCTSSIR